MNGDYDPACLLAAMVELDGSLNGVDGLDAKCRRGKTAGIRRIIVAHDPVNNLIVSPEVQAELAAGPNSVRLDEVANVEQAIDACTGFSRGLRDYLNWVVDLVDTNLPPYFSGRKLSDLYIQPEVFGSQHRLADSDEQSAQSGKSSRSILALGAATEEEELRRHYQNNSEQLRLKWNHEWPRARRSVIVGYPGEGKSVLARMTARALAERGLKELNEQVTGSANVTLPICLRLAEVAEHGSLKAATLAILPTINQLNLPQVVVDHLTDSLIQDHCWLILDGLDEVPTGKRERLRIELANFIQKPCHIILTSRPYGYTSELLPFGSVEEYRLAGLTPDQINAFLQSWFRSSRTPSREKAIRTLLHNNPAMVGLSQNALMLTLTCAEGDIRHLDPDNTRRVHLYYWIIRDLIRGAWQTDPVDIDDKRLDREFRALRRMAWSMFQHHPSRTVFPNDQLLQLLLDQQYTELEAEELLNSWGKRGLLLPGLDTKDQKAGSFFAHRIFLEYLVAEHLASIKGYLDHVHALLWRRDDAGKLCWEPAAIEVLNMLAGCLSDPMPLLEYYLQQDEERPFAFGVFSLLAGLALPDVDARVSNSEVGERITKAIWSNWPEGPLPETVTRALRHPHGISFLLRSFEAGDYRRQECITKVFTTYPDLRALDTLLRGLLESEDCIICEQCADALGLYDDPKTVTALLQAFYQDNPSSDSTPANALRSLYRLRPAEYSSLVQDCLRQHKFETVRYAAAASLGEFGGDWAVQPLLETLWFEKEAWVRETAAKSLISLLGPALPAVLLDVFERETDTNRRMRAVEALGFCPDRIASVALLESIGTLSDVDLLAAVVVSLGRMREQSAISIFTELAEKQTEASLLAALATALGELRHASSFPRLVELLTVGKNEKHVRRAAATALGKLGKPEAVPVLIDILKTDEDYWIRADAAKALGELRDERAINDLIYAVQNDENVVRWSAAEALAKMRSPSLLNVFLRALASDDEYLRREAVIGLRHFIDDQAVEPLLNALKHDNDSEVQFSAADALNEIIKSGLWIRRR
jgi:HEAT repeat protein